MSAQGKIGRQVFHTRRIECAGYRRDDGLWEIEGSICDIKGYDHKIGGKTVNANEPLHAMRVRLTLDDTLLIRDAFAQTDSAPYESCSACTPFYSQLVGMRIGPGFSRSLHDAFGGRKGCTHITALLGSMATTAIQTIGAWLYETQGSTKDAERMIDSCYSLRNDGETVRVHFPQFYARTNT